MWGEKTNVEGRVPCAAVGSTERDHIETEGSRLVPQWFNVGFIIFF